MEEYTPEFTRALVDTLIVEFPPLYFADYRVHDVVAAKNGENVHIVIFSYEDGYDYYVADTLAAAVVECEGRFPDSDGWIVNVQNGNRYLITATVSIRPKPFDIITPSWEATEDD